MKGTEKQIKWAEDIINNARHALKRAEAVAATEDEKTYIAKQIAAFEQNIEKTEAAGWTAKDWIDRRDRFNAQNLLMIVLRDGFKWGYNWQGELTCREKGLKSIILK